ncbi:MAG: 1-acyl-sn-glycerol-3-phosphate acyltransferase [Actinomycetota bacterium]|jgi:1-acyl-sn-glycerol-3-phosphate acyltransferase
MTTRLRAGCNAVVVAIGILVAFPIVPVAERVRRGAGRAVVIGATRVISRLCGIRYVVKGATRLDAATSYVLVPNHSSPLDIPAVLMAWPSARFVAAAELFRIPLLGGTMRALGSVPVDRRRPAEAQRAVERAAEGARDLVVFAEGGIPAVGESRRFKTGAFVLAIAAGADVVPVSITGSAVVLPRGHRFAVRPGTVRIELHSPISTSGCTTADRKALRDRTESTVRAALATT